MNQQEIHASLDKMLENPKSRNFLNHLVRSYMPISNVEKVWDTPNGDFKCVLTRDRLLSVQDVLVGIQTEEFKQNFFTHLKSIFNEDSDKTSPMSKLIGDKKLAVTGKDTTTFMSFPAFQEFYNWVLTKSLGGDKHINWLLGSIRRSSVLDRAELTSKDFPTKVQKPKQTNTETTYSLGDASDILSQLKAKMEADGE